MRRDSIPESPTLTAIEKVKRPHYRTSYLQTAREQLSKDYQAVPSEDKESADDSRCKTLVKNPSEKGIRNLLKYCKKLFSHR